MTASGEFQPVLAGGSNGRCWVGFSRSRLLALRRILTDGVEKGVVIIGES